MQLATLRDGSLDGRLLVVSNDLKRAVQSDAIAPSLIHALQYWDECEPALRRLADALNDGRCGEAKPFDPKSCACLLYTSPSPRD